MGESGEDKSETIADALRVGRRRLAPSGTETPGLDAEVLLRKVLGIDRTALFVQRREPIDRVSAIAYQSLLERRASGVPVAYLTGEREFMGLTIEVRPEVLIPRPETEILVEWALKWLRNRNNATVIDVGTGSGAIALSLAAILGNDWSGQIMAVDVSEGAMALAARNRARLGLEQQVAIVNGSLLSHVSGPVDLVLANLPYLRPDQIAANPALAAEPRQALDGGTDGLDLIRDLLHDAPRVLAAGGAVGLEIDPGQRSSVVSLAAASFPGAAVAVLPDLAGHDRHVTIQLSRDG